LQNLIIIKNDIAIIFKFHRNAGIMLEIIQVEGAFCVFSGTFPLHLLTIDHAGGKKAN
jgi:hypothetical protein